MEEKVKNIITITAAFLLFLVAGCATQAKKQVSESIRVSLQQNNFFLLQLDSITKIIKEGDIIFRGGTDIESNIIKQFSLKDKTFSHCGIAIKKREQLYIVHILGGVDNMNGSIMEQSVDSFINYPQNESLGIYTANLKSEQIHLLKHFLDSVQIKKVSFDIKFNFKTKDKLYCTELLIDALKFVSKNSFYFNPSQFTVQGTKWQFLANDDGKFIFYPIDIFQHSKFLKGKKVFYFPIFNKEEKN